MRERTKGFPTAIAIFFFAAALVWFLFFRPHAQVLEISLLTDQRVVWRSLADRGEEFVISYVHSVNKRPVFDTLRLDGDRIVIVKSRFDSFGAGMPESSTGDGTLEFAPNGWLQWTVNRPVTDFVVRVGRVADHRLFFRGKEYPLSAIGEPGSGLRFRARWMSLYEAMKGRCDS